MRACGLPFRYGSGYPQSPTLFAKNAKTMGHPHQCRGKKSQVMRSRKGRATRQGR